MAKEEDGDGSGDRQLFAGVSARMLGFDDYPDKERKYKNTIERRGAKLTFLMEKGKCTHLIIFSETICDNDPYCALAKRYNITIANEMWIDDSICNSALADASKVFYQPVRDLVGIPESFRLHICVTGYPHPRNIEVKRMIHMMGATLSDEWSEKVTHLISYEFEGPTYKCAKRSKASIVNDKWLEDCLKEWKIVPAANYSAISGLEVELVDAQSKPANNKVAGKSKTPGRQLLTPDNKSSTDKSSKAFSAGTKRSYRNVANGNDLKCKRSLHFGSTSCTSETKIISSPYISMYEYAKGGLTKYVSVPYMPNTRKMGRESVKLMLLNAFGLISDLHCEGKALKGVFNSKNFLISLKRKTVQLQDIEPQTYVKGDGALDKLQFVHMVRSMFGEDLPQDINIWLECIESMDIHENVLRQHINMLHANDIFGEFCVMFHIMQELQALELDKFETILENLHTYDHWKERTFNWAILAKNHRADDIHPDLKPRSSWKSGKDHSWSVFGLMQQIRNCWEHPAKLYKDSLLAVMLGEYDKLLSDVQAELFKAGCLNHLDIENLH